MSQFTEVHNGAVADRPIIWTAASAGKQTDDVPAGSVAHQRRITHYMLYLIHT